MNKIRKTLKCMDMATSFTVLFTISVTHFYPINFSWLIMSLKRIAIRAYGSEIRTNIHLWRMFLSGMEADIVFSSIGIINTTQRMRLKSLQP